MLYDYIDKRRSVRHYTEKLEKSIYDKLMEFIDKSIEPLNKDIRYIIKIVNSDEIKSDKVLAPNYLLFYSEHKKGYELNAGYILEQIDLFLQSNGAGSCWLGMAIPKIKAINNMKYVIMLSLGMTNVHLRSGEQDYKRKLLEEVGNLSDINVLKAIRLAPSAVNNQPWYYKEVNDNKIEVYVERKLIMKLLLKRFDFIDIGISLYYLALALKKQERKYTFVLPSRNENSIINVILE